MQRLKALGLAILALHLPGKGDPPLGQAACGRGAWAGHADIVIEMRAARKGNDRCRRLCA